MRIAFVIPWFGPGLKGGAEQQAWQFATRLARRGHDVSALTTCCRSFLDDWAIDHLPAGIEMVEGVQVHRFPVDARDRPAFDRLNASLLALPRDRLRPGVCPVPPAEAAVWTSENINSRALDAHVAAESERCDAIVFIPYLYGPTLRGLPRVAANAWLQPCLHDECYAYLPDVGTAMHAARGLLFNSQGEQELAARLFGPAVWRKGHVVGGGVESGPLEAHRACRVPAGLEGRRFVLCLGRRDPGKGVDLLLEAFAAMRRREPRGSDLTLVLAGPGEHDYGDAANGVVDLGLVSEADRVPLLRNCVALASPSPNESFSRVLYEAWYVGKPAIVRRSCDATRMPVEACGGGWIAESVDEWASILSRLAQPGSAAAPIAALGENGRAYALEHADWARVIERYEAVLREPRRGAAIIAGRKPAPREPAAIHQLAPNFAYGDAISNEMLAIRALLRDAGYRSNIIVRHFERGAASEIKAFGADALAPDEALIYHHSIGSEVTAAAIAHPGPKGLVYHNITPAEFFRPYRPAHVQLLRGGREQMWHLAPAFPVSAGDSRFNAAELERFGFADPGVLPLPLEAALWDSPPNPHLMEMLQDGRKNVLFVGRVAPNKRQDRLVRAFAALRETTDARLILAGSAPAGDPYADAVRAEAARLGIGHDVIIPGLCGLPDLHAFFRCAHVFWSFSEHEGFCAPLVEAMWFDVPVVAVGCSAIPETLAGAGILFDRTEDDAQAARLVGCVLRDEPLRRRILARSRERRLEFTPERVAASVARFIGRVTAQRLHVESTVPA